VVLVERLAVWVVRKEAMAAAKGVVVVVDKSWEVLVGKEGMVVLLVMKGAEVAVVMEVEVVVEVGKS
jgi:hypothetical protein